MLRLGVISHDAAAAENNIRNFSNCSKILLENIAVRMDDFTPCSISCEGGGATTFRQFLSLLIHPGHGELRVGILHKRTK